MIGGLCAEELALDEHVHSFGRVVVALCLPLLAALGVFARSNFLLDCLLFDTPLLALLPDELRRTGSGLDSAWGRWLEFREKVLGLSGGGGGLGALNDKFGFLHSRWGEGTSFRFVD